METNEKLRMRIADLKGWTDREELMGHVLWGYIHDQTGKKVVGVVPNWPEDPNAAVALAEEIKADGYSNPQIYTIDTDNLWHTAFRSGGDQQYDMFEADTFCVAVCLMWIAWKELKGKS